MEKTTKKWNKSSVKKWLRIIHRDLGFLTVGLCIIYAISGILLNHMDGKDPAYKTVEETLQFAPAQSIDQLTTSWNSNENLPALKKVFKEGENHYRLMLTGGIGVYNKQSGAISYEHHKQRPFVYWINKLHYNKVANWTAIADIFAAALIFLTVSGLFLTSKKSGLRGRGKWYLIIGILIPILYIFLS